MRNCLCLLMTILVLGAGEPVKAGSSTDALTGCLVDTLNGKERKGLARWIFLAIAAHPEIQSYSSATEADLEASDRYVGALITRLLTVDCPREFKAASQEDPQAVEKAFEVVGQVAMQELMTDDEVGRTISGYTRYADMDKIRDVLSGD